MEWCRDIDDSYTQTICDTMTEDTSALKTFFSVQQLWQYRQKTAYLQQK